MEKLSRLRIKLSLTFCLVAMHALQGSTPTTEWKILSHSNGILVSERWIEQNHHTFRERKGEMVVNCPAGEAVKIICDVSSTSRWMKGVSDCALIKRNSAADWYTYTLYNIPYPFDDRDLVSHFRLSNSGNRYTVTIESEAHFIPVKEGINRLNSYNACWEITDLGHSQTRLVFTAMSDTPPMFPRWIQDPILLKIFTGNLSDLRNLIINAQKSN